MASCWSGGFFVFSFTVGLAGAGWSTVIAYSLLPIILLLPASKQGERFLTINYMSSSKVYFIILNFNGYADTIECLESLRRLKNQNFQVILVDNASGNDEGARLAAEFPEYIHILNEKNSGFAGGNNIGVARALQEADCNYLFFLNNDTTVEPDLLDQLLAVVNNPQNQSYGFFQPKMINYFQRNLMDSAGLDYSRNSLGFNRGGNRPIQEYNDNQEILGCCGGAFLCRRQAVEDLWHQAGEFFAQDFFAYCEDLDASLRLQWAGWRALFVANAIVYHKGGQTAQKFTARKVFWPNRNSLWVVIRNWPIKAIIVNFPWLFLGQLGMVVNAFLRRGRLGWWAVKGKWEAFRKLPAMWRCRSSIQQDKQNWYYIKQMMILKWRP